nr:MAG TPA: hypothetical protein [Caudoviricetes sp.]
MYYSHRYLYYNSLYINTLDTLLMTPKGSQVLLHRHLEDILDRPWTRLGHFGIGRKQANIRPFIRPLDA